MSSGHPTTNALEYFFEFLKDHRINDPTKTGDFDSVSIWEDVMNYSISFDEYLHVVMGDEEWARMKWLMSDAPLAGSLIRLSDNVSYWTDYLKNTGLTWADVLYPSRLSGSGAGGYASLNFMSDNIKKLYR